MRSQLSRLLRHTVQPRRANISSIADATRLRTCSSSLLLSNPWQPPQPPQLRNFSTSSSRSSGSAASNPQMAFPCLDAVESRTQEIASRSMTNGPEPSYTTGAHREFTSKDPLLLDYGGRLKEFTIAYETWGEMNADKSNVILLHTGLSASSHAKSNANNPRFGWWEKFIGPGLALDTSRFHVICTNVLGGCYGSTGPACIDPADGKRYATRFPILTMNDMVRAQFRLLDALGVDKLMASVGASMGGMQSLAAGVLHPDRIGRIVSISGCARSHPYSIALRHAQRQVLMADSNWNRGFYYGGVPPHLGMKLARQIATVTYRSGPEWEQRFGRQRADPSRPPALCPDFLIETYLDHAGEKFCLEYDANSLLYVSKAMDLFDLGIANQEGIRRLREKNKHKLLEGSSSGGEHSSGGSQREACTLSLPRVPYTEQQVSNKNTVPSGGDAGNIVVSDDLVLGLSPMRNIPTLVLGVESDILFPAWQQREVADTLRKAGNTRVKHVELGQDASLFGHDSFLLDVKNIGGSVKSFLEEFV